MSATRTEKNIRRLAAALCLSVAAMLPAPAERRSLVGYYPSWFSAKAAPLSAASKAYTHVVIAFARPDFTWNGTSWEGTGLQFSTAPDDVKAQIAGLKARGIRVLLAVGGATYLDWTPLAAEASKPGPISTTLQRFVTEMGFDGIDVDYEIDGATPEVVMQYRAVITALRRAADKKTLSLAAWSTGADCTQASGTRGCGGKTTTWDGRAGRERLMLNDKTVLRQIDMVSVMSYDAGVANFDPVKAWALYRSLFPRRVPVHIGFETAPEGWGAATLVKDDAAATCENAKILADQFGNPVNKSYSVERALRDGPLTQRKNSNPQDGAMLWHIVKDQNLPNCGHSVAVSPRELELTARVLLDRQRSASPAFSEDTDDH